MNGLKYENMHTILKEKLSHDETLYAMKLCHDLNLPETACELSFKFIRLKDYRNFTIGEEKLISDILHSYIGKYKRGWKSLKENLSKYKNESQSDINIDDNNSSNSDNDGLSSVSFSNRIDMIEKELNLYEEHIQSKCLEITSDLDIIVKVVTDNRSRIHFSKLKANFFGHYIEMASEDEFGKIVEGQKIYQECYEASAELEDDDYLYLSIAIDYSTFLSSILNHNEKAYLIASQTYERAKGKNKGQSDFSLYLSILESKLCVWKTEILDFNS